MKFLLISDHVNPFLYDYYAPGRFDGYDAILSCGDLSEKYLEFIATLAKCPVIFVRGNHDPENFYPGGCFCADDKVIDIKGVKIFGISGVPFYNDGPNQYKKRAFKRRLFRAERKIRKAGGVDILLTHAAPRGYGDGDDFAHRGFEDLVPFVKQSKPKYLVHGHVHLNYGHKIDRIHNLEGTTIINAFDKYILEF